MPIDFKKLSDPVFKEQARNEREAKEAIAEEKNNRIRIALDVCVSNCNQLSDQERQFVNSCSRQTNVHYRELSEKQEKWLFDIESRLKQIVSVEMRSQSRKPN